MPVRTWESEYDEDGNLVRIGSGWRATGIREGRTRPCPSCGAVVLYVENRGAFFNATDGRLHSCAEAAAVDAALLRQLDEVIAHAPLEPEPTWNAEYDGNSNVSRIAYTTLQYLLRNGAAQACTGRLDNDQRCASAVVSYGDRIYNATDGRAHTCGEPARAPEAGRRRPQVEADQIREALSALGGRYSRPYDAPEGDTRRLLFVEQLLTERDRQAREYTDDRPEQTEMWWADMIAMYADRAIDVGGNRNGLFHDGMLQVAALALAAWEWHMAGRSSSPRTEGAAGDRPFDHFSLDRLPAEQAERIFGAAGGGVDHVLSHSTADALTEAIRAAGEAQVFLGDPMAEGGLEPLGVANEVSVSYLPSDAEQGALSAALASSGTRLRVRCAVCNGAGGHVADVDGREVAPCSSCGGTGWADLPVTGARITADSPPRPQGNGYGIFFGNPSSDNWLQRTYLDPARSFARPGDIVRFGEDVGVVRSVSHDASGTRLQVQDVGGSRLSDLHSLTASVAARRGITEDEARAELLDAVQAQVTAAEHATDALRWAALAGGADALRSAGHRRRASYLGLDLAAGEAVSSQPDTDSAGDANDE